MQKCLFKSYFFRHEITKLPDKIIMENCLFISKSTKSNLPPIFNHWFTFSSDSHNHETSSPSKGLLKVKTVNTKKYGRDLSCSKLKSLLLKYFLKSYSNNA